MQPSISCRHVPDHRRIELLDGTRVIGEVDYLEATTADGEPAWDMVHTGVRPEYRNQGLAADLVRYAVDTAAQQGQRVIPTCPYIQLWVRKNPDYQAPIG